MSKCKLFEDVDELFVKTKTKPSETKIVGIEIPGFLEKIEKNEEFSSPNFKLAGVEFYIRVGFCSEFIDVQLVNYSGEDQTISVTFTEESGVKKSIQTDTIDAKYYRTDGWLGFPEFLSYEDYEAWAKDHGDVFKLKAKVTLHQKVMDEDEDGWIRYVMILYCLFG